MAAAEIAAALHQSPRGAAHRVAAALELVDHLPATLCALQDGRIDKARAAVIADRTHQLHPDLRNAVEAAAVELAATRTPCPGKPMIDRRVIAADPDAARKRTQQARTDRCVLRQAGEDGMGVIKAILPAEGAVSVYELLDSIARATASSDGRPIGALRADALIDICVALLTTGHVDVRPMGTTSKSTGEAEPAAGAGIEDEAERADGTCGEHGPSTGEGSTSVDTAADETAPTGTPSAEIAE